MKKNSIRRITALILALMMILPLGGCGEEEKVGETSTEFAAESTTQAKTLARAPQGDSETAELTVNGAEELSNEKLRYVMIYNPRIYDEQRSNDDTVRRTGYLGNQIDVSAYRADGLDKELKIFTIPQTYNFDDIKINTESIRGDFIPKTYSVGDKKEFYCFSETSTDIRVEKTFECVYVGEHCHIWSEGGLDVNALSECGKEFDEKIFNQVIDTFGEPRFSGKKGKVNLLFSKLPGSIWGVFRPLDLFSKSEVSESEIVLEKMNTDHDILYINSLAVGREEYKKSLNSTMAHEFQHLICMTNVFSTPTFTLCRSWLNEAMSGYVEEYLYPGVQLDANRYGNYNDSYLIRKGQSLYNFNNTYDDIGVYGSVFLFSQYLTKVSDKNVFSRIHDYWRNGFDYNLSEATAIRESVSSSLKSKIDSLVTYPSSWIFGSNAEEWMSKLTLDFYLSVLSNKDSVAGFENVNPEALLYDEINSAEIEGGGRIVVAVNETTFKIPEEADAGFVYVGLDENFEVVTPFICS